MKPLTKSERALMERLGKGEQIKVVIRDGDLQGYWIPAIAVPLMGREDHVKMRPVTSLSGYGFLRCDLLRDWAERCGMTAIFALSDQGKLRLSMEAERDRVGGQIKSHKAVKR